MVSTFTTNLNIELPGHNDDVGTWDTPTNANWSLVDNMAGGSLLLNATGLSGSQALTNIQLQPRTVQISGAPTAAVTYTVPSGVGGQWIVRNTTSGGFNVGFASAAGGSTILIPASGQYQVWCDGTATGVLLSDSTRTGVLYPYAGTTAPVWALFAFGQAVSRTTYANLFATIGTTFGAGDGLTTFNVPDARGRALVGRDDMGGTAVNRITNAVSGITGTTLGAAGGDQQMQAHSHTTQFPILTFLNTGSGVITVDPGSSNGLFQFNGTTTTGAGGSQNVQPTLIVNYIIGI